MTDTLTGNPATVIHEACALAPTGMHRAALQSLTGLPDDVFTTALDFAVITGRISHTGGVYRAQDVCTTCGFGAADRHYADTHTDGCDTSPADHCAGYPTTF